MFDNKRLVVVLIIMIVSSGLVSQQSMNQFIVHASESLYGLGYDHGCEDAGLAESESYAPESVQAIQANTDEWVRGYFDGYSGCGGDISPTDRGFESSEEESTEETTLRNSDRGQTTTAQSPSSQATGIDWIKICNDLQSALVSSCDVLVNSDNTLTTEGERAVGCIRNGIALAGGGSLLLSLPLPLVVTALQILEEPTGCGGIVEWGLIGEVGDLKGIINRLA